jgi:hypothetical protein
MMGCSRLNALRSAVVTSHLVGRYSSFACYYFLLLPYALKSYVLLSINMVCLFMSRLSGPVSFL